MNIWLVTVGEPLPIDGYNERLYRTGITAELISKQGYEVTWWTSGFDHVRKKHRKQLQNSIKLRDNYTIKLLQTPGYKKNISIRRIVDHYQLAKSFRYLSKFEKKPDIILTSLPTLYLSSSVVDFGKTMKLPVVVDIRDLWPDIFSEVLPSWLCCGARLFMRPLFRKVDYICRGATAITGITPAFVEWGLGHAKRGKTDLDCSFPLAYSENIPNRVAIENAEATWNELGVYADKNQFNVCFFGNMAQNVLELEDVIKAAKKLNKTNANIKFILCGNGDYYHEYKAMAQGMDNVLMPGRVGASEIWTLMRRSSIGILPYQSRKDFVKSYPNKAIEYLSAGLPVVSSLKGALQELLEVNKCGITYENGKGEQLAEIITWLFDNPDEIKTFSENANELFHKRFVAEQVYSDMINHLQLVCNEYKGGK